MASSTHYQTNSVQQISLDQIQCQQNITIAIERDYDDQCTPNNSPNQENIHNDFVNNRATMIEHSKHYNKSHKKKRKHDDEKHQKQKKKIRSPVTNKNGNKNMKISQIEIYDIINDEDLEFKQQFECEKSIHFIKMENENEFNDDILKKAKRPYYILIFISVLFIAIFIMNFIDILKYFEFNGLTPSILSVIMLIPLFLCFKYFENKIIFQHKIIYKKIMETYSLKKKLHITQNDNLQQKKYIDDLKLIIKEQEIEINKLSSNKKLKLNHEINLLHGFRKGQMELQIEFAEIGELIDMFNIVVSCITLLPFGMTNYRTKLKRILEAKIENNRYLEMHFYFFLLSYLQCIDVKRLFRKHKIMKKVRKISDFYQYNHSNHSNHCEINDISSETPTDIKYGNNTPYNYNQNNIISPLPTYNVVDINRLNRLNINMNRTEDIIYFKDSDPIKLFRSPLDHFAKVGFTVIIPPELQNRFFDPINGNHCVQQLKVRWIFNSNARPYLIDCYVKNDGINCIKKTRKRKRNNTTNTMSPCSSDNKSDNKSPLNPMLLSSSFILKKGDDLRRDQAVLQMFKFMNSIWKENGLKYMNKHFVSCLIYKCFPIGNDVGIIEIISNCIELNKIMTLKTTLFTAHCGDDDKITNKFHRLIASSAGSYIGSFVCGIRDRHDDNILIDTKKCILFHIDYNYIFNNKVSLDTAKFAITSDLKKIFQLYKYGWNDFVNLCVDSWSILRQNASELIDFARVVFAFLYESNEIELFLRDSLKLDMTPENAKKYICNKIQNAPKQWKTKMKNLVHGFAQKIKSDNKVIL